jgi:2'-5' RNA ligase
MIALYPPADIVTALWQDGGLAAEELHCTVAYLGDEADIELKSALAAATSVARRRPIAGSVAGHARFTGGEQDVLVGLVDSAELETLRRDVVDALTSAGITIPAEHGYTPHITIRYLAADEDPLVDRIPAMPVRFDSIALVYGSRRIDIPFGDAAGESITPYARTAYAQGWAVSGGPMTERVKAGCRAAIALAVEHAHDPDVLEATLKLGQLEGIWALVYDRREKVYGAHIDAIASLWRRAASRVDLQLAVRRFRDSLGLGEAVGDDDHRQMAARAVAAAVVATIAGQSSHPADRDELVAAIVAALKAGYAEGIAGALAVGAQEDDVEDFDIDTAYTVALAQIDDRQFHHQALTLLTQLHDALTKQLAKVLAGASPDMGFDEMVELARRTVGAGGVAALLALLIDFAIGQMVTAGTLALYRRYHVTQLAYVTAGDDNVCSVCEDAEAGSPYAADEVPDPPLHPRCRCVLVATGELPARAYSDFQ